MRNLKLLRQMKEQYGITFSDNPCYYIENNIETGTGNDLNHKPVRNHYSENVIYENINPMSGCLNLQLESCDKEHKYNNYKSKMFRTTFSMKIGEIDESSVKKPKDIRYQPKNNESIPDKQSKPEEENLKPMEIVIEPQLEVTENDIEVSDDLEEGSFKSSYAKLLADSYQRKSIQLNSILFLQSDKKDQPISAVVSMEDQSKCEEKYEDLVKQMLTLYRKLTTTEEDLTSARNEILTLKLESARLKAENRSMMAAEATINSPFKQREIDKSLKSYLKSDTWTLQQKVVRLTNQLEKAEITKYAYESATAQLVTFLKTVTSTLIPLTNEENHSGQSNCSHTIGILSDIENTLKENKKIYSREKSFFGMNNLKNSFQPIDTKISNQKIKRKRHKSVNSSNSISSGGNYVNKEFNKLDQKRSKGKLRRSESFSDLPLDHNLPRVTRALSADVICEDVNYKMESHKDLNLISSLKNKLLFSSLKNVFKIEGEKSTESCSNKPKKKKKGFLSFSKRSKRNPSPVRYDDGPQSLQSSTFYVNYPNSEDEPVDSLPTCVESNVTTSLDIPESDQSPSELMSGPREISVTLSMMDLGLADIASPSGYVEGKDSEVETARSDDVQNAESCRV